MNYIKIETTSCSYRVVGVFCDFDQTEVEDMFNEFYDLYQLPKEYLVNGAVFKVSVSYVTNNEFVDVFGFNVVERIK